MQTTPNIAESAEELSLFNACHSDKISDAVSEPFLLSRRSPKQTERKQSRQLSRGCSFFALKSLGKASHVF